MKTPEEWQTIYCETKTLELPSFISAIQQDAHHDMVSKEEVRKTKGLLLKIIKCEHPWFTERQHVIDEYNRLKTLIGEESKPELNAADAVCEIRADWDAKEQRKGE